MASILPVNGKWRALIRRKGFKAECKTFPTKAQAERWARQREAQMDSGAVPADVSLLTVAQAIRTYRRLRAETRPILDTSNEHYQLNCLDRHLGPRIIARMTPQDLVDFASSRAEDGAGPYTINMDVSKLGTVLRYAGAAERMALPDIVGAARPLLTHLRLIGSGGARERRPTQDEMVRLLAHLRDTYGLVYAEAVAFAAVSAMRRGELTAFGREDLDAHHKTVAVWRKHPRRGKVLERVPLLPAAWEIIERQPVGEPEPVVLLTDRGPVTAMRTRVFPIHPSTLSKYFTWSCRDLGIPDLHLHDMRHEGTSSLFELGYDIPEAALFSGHKDWKNLKRYTNLRPESVRRLSAEPSRNTQPHPGNPPSADPLPCTSSPGTSER